MFQHEGEIVIQFEKFAFTAQMSPEEAQELVRELKKQTGMDDGGGEPLFFIPKFMM